MRPTDTWKKLRAVSVSDAKDDGDRVRKTGGGGGWVAVEGEVEVVGWGRWLRVGVVEERVVWEAVDAFCAALGLRSLEDMLLRW